MSTLYDTKWLDDNIHTLPDWKKIAYQYFHSVVADDDNTYPCIPARHGLLTNNLRFSFLGDPRKSRSIEELASTLREYGKCSRGTGKYASLVVFFETDKELIESYEIDDYFNLFWSILSNVSSLDHADWPNHIPTDPAHHEWEFCFDGEPYFSFCTTPAHSVRKSRHFPSFMLAFQPRWVFEEISDSTAFGRNMKKQIRKRLVEFDGIPVHSDLKWYGNNDNHEWKQYFLNDDDTSPSKCPFMRMKTILSKFIK
ncbi:YqcI/YcgG family protein [Bacillus sp. BGMRC 2118]|nr:YqcI/YcgG family protein [Bacillus sp. BGMRC 2118]